MNATVWHERLLAIADVMLADFAQPHASAAVLNTDARVTALAGASPLAFGALGFGARALIAAVTPGRDESAYTNDPACGGTALTDLMWLAPAHVDGELVGYVALAAHHAALGANFRVGYAAITGALPEVEAPPPAVGPRYENTSVVHNVVPEAVSSLDDGELVRAQKSPPDALAFAPAQHAAVMRGAASLSALGTQHGALHLKAAGAALLHASAVRAREAVAKIPPGIYAFADSLDDGSATGNPLVIRLNLTIANDTLTFDFSDSDPASRGCTNATIATTLAAVAGALRQIIPDAALNDGLLSVIDLRAKPGTVVAAPESASVWGGARETVRRIADVVLGAFAQALPEHVPAASAGTGSFIAIEHDGGTLTVELAGGAGASPTKSGAHALDRYVAAQSVEALERAGLVRVTQQALREASGGGGVQSGGDGVARELTFLRDVTLTLLGDRRKQPPYGLRGGGPGLVAQDLLVRDGRSVKLPSKIRFHVRRGDRLVTLTPGGAGDGDPMRGKFWASLMSGEPLEFP